MDPEDEITTNTIRAIIFAEIGFLVQVEELEEEDIKRLENVILPYEMGLYKRETYNKFIVEVCSEILMRIKAIEVPLKEEEVAKQ